MGQCQSNIYIAPIGCGLEIFNHLGFRPSLPAPL